MMSDLPMMMMFIGTETVVTQLVIVMSLQKANVSLQKAKFSSASRVQVRHLPRTTLSAFF